MRRRFGLGESVKLEAPPRWNVAPTDPVLAIREDSSGERQAGMLRWGLVLGRDVPKGRPLINARAETIDERPAFRAAFRQRRCLIPADGFYEWRLTDYGKQPVWITTGELFAFAGIWAKAGDLHSCAIVTCEPSRQVSEVHDRMPVILPPEAEAAWLDPEADPGGLRELLRPWSGELEMREVSEAVNDVRNDGPEVLEPPLKLL